MVDVVRTLKDLVSTPSVNPAFLPEGHPRAGESRVGKVLSDMALKAGMDVELQEVVHGRHNVLIRLAPRDAVRRTIWLAPHLDTVNGTDDQFKPRVKGDRLFGRGACDTKGSVAAMFTAMCDLANRKQRPRQTAIVLAALVDEENAQWGSRALAASGLRADLAIVGEPTLNRVVTAHKGNLWIRLETTGRAAHGSRPELGDNAVHEMARIVDALETEYAARLAKKQHLLLGCATVNVGAISGGTQANIVPDHCSIQIDRRTLPGETERGVLDEILEFLNEQDLEARISMIRPEECLAMETDSRLELVSLLLRSARQKSPAGAHYFCDASVLSKGGIPSVVFGLGNISQAHTTDEWISIRSLERSRAVLGRFLAAQP